MMAIDLDGARLRYQLRMEQRGSASDESRTWPMLVADRLSGKVFRLESLRDARLLASHGRYSIHAMRRRLLAR